MIDPQSYPVPERGVVGRQLEGEAVVVLPARGRVKVLNKVGARIWALADGSRTVEEIAAALGEEFAVGPEQAREDVHEFLARLADQGAIRFATRPAAGPATPHDA